MDYIEDLNKLLGGDMIHTFNCENAIIWDINNRKCILLEAYILPKSLIDIICEYLASCINIINHYQSSSELYLEFMYENFKGEYRINSAFKYIDININDTFHLYSVSTALINGPYTTGHTISIYDHSEMCDINEYYISYPNVLNRIENEIINEKFFSNQQKCIKYKISVALIIPFSHTNSIYRNKTDFLILFFNDLESLNIFKNLYNICRYSLLPHIEKHKFTKI
jgi:hypothetical protein